MIFILFAWLYISITCNSWGRVMLALLPKPAADHAETNLHPVLINLVGMAGLGCILQLIGLFIGLGSAWIQLVVILPAVFSFRRLLKTQFLENWKTRCRQTPTVILLQMAMVAMILVMSSYPVSHPDTEAYHYPLIEWASQYGAVHGLANLDYLFGLQSSWFLICAAFRFGFLNIQAVTFVNSATAVWVALFICDQVADSINARKQLSALLWLLLTGLMLWDYPQIRLTVTSASPDFIAAIFVLCALYLLIKTGEPNMRIIAAFFCFVAVTTKLSATPALLLTLYALPPLKSRNIVAFSAIAAICIIPFLLRNFISSGFPLFPSAIGNWWHPDWQYNPENLENISHFVRSFARVHSTAPGILQYADIPAKWFPLWWAGLSVSGKVMVGVQPLFTIIWILSRKKIEAAHHILLAMLFTGLLFWFFKAPDPRFGYAFLIGFPGVLVSALLRQPLSSIITNLTQRHITIFCAVMSLAVLSYDFYRCKFYLSADNIVLPPDKAFTYKQTYYEEVKASLPLLERNRTAIPADTVRMNESGFRFRGQELSDGFRQYQ